MTTVDKLMYISNDDTQNYPLCKLQLFVKNLDTQLNEPTNQNTLHSISNKLREHMTWKDA